MLLRDHGHASEEGLPGKHFARRIVLTGLKRSAHGALLC